jgi:DNA-directed RNA polymerase subunit RPC12/RpoP
MRYQCPNCADYCETDDDAESARCPRCSARLRARPTTAADDASALDKQPRPVRAIPAAYIPPTMIPIPIQTESPEYVEEKIEDMRDRRRSRHERDREWREDRSSNPLGVTGLALNATALLLIASGALFSTNLKSYAWFMAVLSVPMVLTGLPCSLVGALRPSRIRYVAWIGVGLGALLIVILIPALMMTLLGKDK